MTAPSSSSNILIGGASSRNEVRLSCWFGPARHVASAQTSLQPNIERGRLFRWLAQVLSQERERPAKDGYNLDISESSKIHKNKENQLKTSMSQI
jgi:hypothetical protein